MAGERGAPRVPVWLAGIGARLVRRVVSARESSASPTAKARVERLDTLKALLSPGRIGYAALVIALAFLFQAGALAHGRAVNRDFRPKDQGAYLNLAAQMAASKRIEVDGARPPLYPALIALVHDDSLSRQEFFEKAKTQSVRLTLFAWLFLLWAFRRWLRPLTALAAWAAIGFPLLMFYAPYVKAEALFYVLSLCSFVCILEVIFRPRLGFAALAGVATGAAQLSKESMLPAIALFAGVQALAAGVRLAIGLRREGQAFPKRALIRRALTIPVLAGAFLVTVYPHVRVNERVFGHHFYNVNSYFYIWYDSWGQVVRGTRAHGDRQGYPTMPPERLPSAKKYWESHSVEQIQNRIVRGANGAISNAAKSHGFFDYACFGLFATVIAFATNPRVRRFARQHWPLVLFCVGYFAGYFLMCTWFFAIHPGVRFIAALAPPLIFVGAWLSDRSRFARARGALAVFTVVAAASLSLDIPIAFWHLIENMTGSGW